MRLTELIDDAASSAGYKFDLLDAETKEVVKVFAARDALVEAVAIAGQDRSFDQVLIEAANTKSDRWELEEDGMSLISRCDLQV